MTGLFMLAFSFALNTDTQKPHTHVFTSHVVVIVHHVSTAGPYYFTVQHMSSVSMYDHPTLWELQEEALVGINTTDVQSISDPFQIENFCKGILALE